MVPALFAELPRPGGDDGGARPVGGSRHDLALGPALCTYSESASASRTSASQSLLAGGRKLRPGRRRLDVPVSSRGFSRGHDRFFVVSQPGSDCGEAIAALGLVWNWRDPAAGDPCGWTPRICPRDCEAEAVGRTQSALSLSAITLFKRMCCKISGTSLISCTQWPDPSRRCSNGDTS